nr:uncharacterized protein LOC109401472 [Aedes albopictus]
MNRAKKYCCYRDCNVNSQTHPELTLFQFPKSDLRAAKWCELGCVDPADIRLQFMCELHFSRIYMCFSSRRKMLLSTAIPYAYGEPIQDQEEVQSSSSMLENEDISIEEHLDESVMDEDDDVATEIVYIHPEEEDPIQTDELIEPLFSKKRSASTETQVYTKIIKVEKMPPISHSMLVSSSSSCTTPPTDDTLKPITPPKGTILRKVKLKKRPAAPKTFVNRTIKPCSAAQSTTVEATPAELTVSSSPEKKSPPTNADSDASPDEELPKGTHSSPKQVVEPVASSSHSAVDKTDDIASKSVKKENKPLEEKSTSPVKKDEPIYEFIFKGEEYVQLPKAKYYGEQRELQKRLERCESEKAQMQKKLDYYRRTIGELKKLLANVGDDDNDESAE